MTSPPLTQALNQIEQYLQAIAPDWAKHLRSGLTSAAITEKLAALPFLLPVEVYELYQWHDGSDPEFPVQLFPNYSFLSLDDALAAYAQTIAIYENLGIEDWRSLYNPHWFPLFAEAGNYYLVQGVDQGTAPPPPTAPILDFFSEDPETPVVFDSLTALMQAISACWQTGAYRVEPLGEGQWQTVGDERCDRLWLAFQPQRVAQIAALTRGESAQLTPEQQRQGYMDLVATQPDVALPTLSAELTTRSQTDPEHCYDLIYALGRLQTPEAAASLFPYLSHAHPGIRAAVVMTLVWTVPAPILQAVPDVAAIVPPLLSLLTDDPVWIPQMRDVVLLLGRIGDSRAVTPLITLLTAMSTAGVGVASSVAHLADRDTRLAIVTSLGQLGERQAAGPLYDVAQTDADPTVRLWAAKALRQLGDDRGVVVLQALVDAGIPGISERAHQELGR